MKGPRSFQAAGEIAEGLHHALSYSREAYDYMTENVRIGAERAGRDWRGPRHRRLGRDRRLRGLGGGQARGAHPRRLLHLLDAAGAARPPRHRRGRARSRSSTRSARATSRRPSSCSSPSTPRSSRIAGTPEECVEKIKTDIQPTGVNHMILALADAAIVKLFSGEEVAERAGHQRPAAPRGRAGDAGVRARAALITRRRAERSRPGPPHGEAEIRLPLLLLDIVDPLLECSIEGRGKPAAKRMAADERDGAVGVDPVTVPQLADEPEGVAGSGPAAASGERGRPGLERPAPRSRCAGAASRAPWRGSRSCPTSRSRPGGRRRDRGRACPARSRRSAPTPRARPRGWSPVEHAPGLPGLSGRARARPRGRGRPRAPPRARS